MTKARQLPEAGERRAKGDVEATAEAPRPIPLAPMLFTIVGALIVGLGLAGREFGAPGVVLGLAGATLIACIAAFWTSVRTMIGETKLSGAEAFAIGTTGGAMEQKRAVLRALKDLEFERAVGKISDDDYKVLVARYRADAKRLLKQIDEASAERRSRAEDLVNKQLEKLGLLSTAPKASEPQQTPAAEGVTKEAPDAEPVPDAPTDAVVVAGDNAKADEDRAENNDGDKAKGERDA